LEIKILKISARPVPSLTQAIKGNWIYDWRSRNRLFPQ